MTKPPSPHDNAAAKEKYGPWAVIAGASDGTGEHFARELAAMGINLVLSARREPVLRALGEELKAANGIDYRIHVQDLMDEDAGARLLEAADGLNVGLYVSNAGAGVDASGTAFLDSPVERWHRLANMNVRTVMDTCHGFGLRMRERGSGGLLIMCSMSALLGIPYIATYASTKSFEAVFCEALWGELRPHNIDVLAVLAPAMDTPNFRATTEGTGFLISPDMCYSPKEVVRDALGWLPHGPLLFYPQQPGGEDMRPMMAERKARLEAVTALGESFSKPAAS
ncbi:MAG: SDR family NAD(P)-dependent oxidoreductase [Alphaproteobacteria bacterium]|nr:SDR family NAD(P)-dependent oxidoreductase [Alphaproteobacteria bacterium]